MAVKALTDVYHSLPPFTWEGMIKFGQSYPSTIVALFTIQQYYVSKERGNPSFKKLVTAIVLGAATGTCSHFLWIGAQKICKLTAPFFTSILPFLGWLVSLTISLVLIAEIRSDIKRPEE